MPQTLKSKTINSSITEIFQLISKAEKIAITSHVNPDGDAIGSEIAMYNFLLHEQKNVRIINCSPLPYNVSFLDGVDKIEEYVPTLHDEFLLSADLIFVLDLNDFSRIKAMESILLRSTAKKIIIDHHLPSQQYDALYLSDIEVTSTGELVWELLNASPNYKIPSVSASALYTAIMTDSGSFRFPKTDAKVHRIIASLIESGANPVKIYEEYYNIIPLKSVKLLGYALANAELHHDGKLCILQLPAKIFQQTGTNMSDVEGIVEYSTKTKGVLVGALISEDITEKEIRLSLRSKGEVYIRDIAVKFGGGGHEQAAGARLKNIAFANAKKQVIKECKSLFPDSTI